MYINYFCNINYFEKKGVGAKRCLSDVLKHKLTFDHKLLCCMRVVQVMVS